MSRQTEPQERTPKANNQDFEGSTEGFLGPNEKLLDVLATDNAYVVDNLRLSHQALARPLGIASIVGVLLIFWHKVMAFCGRIVNRFRGTPSAAPIETKDTSPSS